MSSFSNELTEKQAEALAVLSEECGEVVQAASKILRHGLLSFSPFDTECITNQDALEKELGGLVAAIDYLIESLPLSFDAVEKYGFQKQDDFPKWLHHCGVTP